MLTLAEHLQALELELLTTATRNDAVRLSQLLAEDFREFGSSGQVFTRQGILLALAQEPPALLSASDFHVTRLADNVALVTYRSTRSSIHDSTRQQSAGAPLAFSVHALRSSIWRRQHDGAWRMVFHQGTRLP